MTKLKERFDTLSDAIIAIIMTILVLEITVPHNTTELIGLFEEIGLFIISFIILIDFWYQRTNLMNLAKQTTHQAFVVDVLFHLSLSLFPIAVKMLVNYPNPTISILFFGSINLIAALLYHLLALIIVKNELSTRQWQKATFIHHWLAKRTVFVFLFDIILLGIALIIPKYGIFIYFLTPIFEFIANYRKGIRFEELIKQVKDNLSQNSTTTKKD